jgi:methyl-accepting chemotaxis protein
VQLRKATAEQAGGAAQVVTAIDAMRKSGNSASRAVAEQATAAEQASKEAQRVAKLVASVDRTLAEQSTGTNQIRAAAESLRMQSENAARGMQEQNRAVRDLTAASQNIAKQIRLITAANLEHSATAEIVQQTAAQLQEGSNGAPAPKGESAAGGPARRRRAGSAKFHSEANDNAARGTKAQ